MGIVYVLLNSATHDSLILTSNEKQKGKVMEKSPIFIGVASPMNGYVGVGLARGKEHTRQRKALAPALSKNALYGQEEIIQRHISALLEALRRKIGAGEVANMSDYCMFVFLFFCVDLSMESKKIRLLTWFFLLLLQIHSSHSTSLENYPMASHLVVSLKARRQNGPNPSFM